MIRAGIIGLGKMGLSHQSMVSVHPDIQLESVCDSSGYILDVLSRYISVAGSCSVPPAGHNIAQTRPAVRAAVAPFPRYHAQRASDFTGES